MEKLIKMLQSELIQAPEKSKCTNLENKMYDNMEILLKNLQEIEEYAGFKNNK